MADNIPVTPGLGASVATDDISGHHYQRIKMYYGPEGSATAPSTGNGVTDAGTQRMVHATDDPVISKLTGPGTSTTSSVASSATSVTLLAANAARKGAVITNDDDNPLRVRYSASAASAADYTVLLLKNQAHELAVCQGGVYTGAITGIWEAAGSGAARVTQLT
jgi:hypothetical protein